MIIERPRENIPKFFLQWHLTTKCDYNCKHCYVKEESTYKGEVENELDTEQCLKIIDDFIKTLKIWKIRGSINLTGGDPLLRKDIFKIIKYIRKNNIEVSILGNSTYMNDKNIKKLDSLKLDRYQMSIDGIEDVHDDFRRKKGSFKEILKTMKLIREGSSITPVVMSTLCKENMNDMEKIVDYSCQNGAKLVAFARLVPIGSGKEIRDGSLSIEEFKKSFEILSRKEREVGNKIKIGHKDPLWSLYEYEKGIFKPEKCKDCIISGCSIGWSGMSVLADGTVLPCRRLPLKIGNLSEQTIRDVFVDSTVLDEIRDVNNIEKCNGCELRSYCRGCRAVAYALKGDYLAADPHCWKE